MKTIWKFVLPIKDGIQAIKMPRGSIIRHVGDQTNVGDSIQMWVEVNASEPEYKYEERNFQVFGTGHPIGIEQFFTEEFSFVGTVITAGGNLVWHIYERP